jgi:hypothetical protein
LVSPLLHLHKIYIHYRKEVDADNMSFISNLSNILNNDETQSNLDEKLSDFRSIPIIKMPIGLTKIKSENSPKDLVTLETHNNDDRYEL